MTPADAFARAYRYTAADGWTIKDADKDEGVITATGPLLLGHGKTAPLIIFVEKEGEGSKVQLIFGTPQGATAQAQAVQQHFCKTLAAIAAK